MLKRIWQSIFGKKPFHDTEKLPEYESEEKEQKRMLASFSKGRCPDCGGSMFKPGPQGGMSQNILCVKCRTEFNVSPMNDGKWMGPPFMIQRIGRSPEETKQIYGE